MRCNLSGPLAAVLLLAVASVPCPASWLDDTTHNVGVEAILAPRGTIDSGVAVTPTVVVANYGTNAESLWAFMAINDGTPNGYLDSLWLPDLAPTQRETVAFGAWIPRGRDSMEAVAWTECESDTFPHDDTCRVKFLVRAAELALEIIVPRNGDTLDSGEVFYPQCRVWNLTSHSLSIEIRFIIGPYRVTRNINLIAGGSTVVTSPVPYTAMPPGGFVVVEASAGGRVYADTSWFYVRGGAGVEEVANGEGRMADRGASVLRFLPPDAVASDAMGRRVVNPKPGVYFMREGLGTRGQGFGKIRKIIIQR